MRILRRLWDLLVNWLKGSSISEIEYMPIEPKEPVIIEEPVEKLGEKLIRIADALTLLNTDITPLDDKVKGGVKDEVGCVEAVCEVINKVMPFPRLTYTPHLVQELKKNPRFTPTLDFNEAHIIVCATGTGNGTMRGHCGIIGRGDEIISNNSSNGRWEYNYTIDAWKARFRTKGGLPILLFKVV